MSRALKSLLIIVTMVGCDGKPELPFEPPPVSPGVTRLTVAITAPPGSLPVTLNRGDTIVLTAVVRHQGGDEVTTGTVDWKLDIIAGPPSGTPSEVLAYAFAVEPIGSRSVRVVGYSVASALVTGTIAGVGASISVAVVGVQHPFIWSAEAGMKLIPTPGPFGEALAINNRGEVVGWYGVRRNGGRAFLWSEANGFRDIGPEGDLGHSVARAINEQGVVAGETAYGSETNLGFVFRDGVSRVFSWTDEITGVHGINDDGAVVGEMKPFESGGVSVRSRRAFLWTDSSGVLALPLAAGMGTSRAFDINNKGEIVGYDGEREAGFNTIQVMAPAPVVWNRKSDTPTELFGRKSAGCENGWEPLLSYDNACAAVAVGINDAGQIAGVIGERAFRRGAGQGAVMFPDATVPSTATGINSRGDVSGHVLEPSALIPESVRAGFVWLADGRVVKLGTLPGAVSTYANAINDRGQVVGYVY